MPHADESPFARRMMDKGVSEGLNTDVNHRIFYDPPELIQIAFGGRGWFIERGNTRVHRIGIFGGLSWQLDPVVASECAKNRSKYELINAVRITARKLRSGSPQLYDMEFLRRNTIYDDDGTFLGVDSHVVTHRTGLEAAQLPVIYGQIIGEQAL